MAAPDRELRILLVGSAGRRSRELRIPTILPALLAALVVLVPLGAGAALGAEHGGAVGWPIRLASLADTAVGSPQSRLTSYMVRARAQAPAKPAARVVRVPPRPTVEELLGREGATPEHRRGHLRIRSLHHEETVDLVPFDAHGARNEDAFAALSHLFRCRITGHEVAIDEGLVRLLTALNDLYDKPVHLISGHRTPHTLDTSETSQHTVGTAADVRVPGVSVRQLREVARRLGARGVGLYSQKRFVHIDFRKHRRYFWSDALAADTSTPRAAAPTPHGALAEGHDGSSDSAGSPSEGLATVATAPRQEG